MINENALFDSLAHGDFCVIDLLEILNIETEELGFGDGRIICRTGICADCWRRAFDGIKNKMDAGIELKNINLDGITMMMQMYKLDEEINEFKVEVLSNNPTNAIEEYFDMVQAGLGLLQKMGLSADYVMHQYPKHLKKIKNRPREK